MRIIIGMRPSNYRAANLLFFMKKDYLEYVAAKREENIQRELKIKEMQETAINQKAEAEYQIYLRLKEKFEGELK